MPHKVLYSRAEELIMRDKFNDTEQMKMLIKDVKNLLSAYADFDEKDLFVGTVLSDSLILNVQVKVKKFKHFCNIGKKF
ncbi:MAG: hypothetical protein NC350_06045 [Corallococcus sp.]|nr:hypothetical protein [Corallococcus sp.]